MIHSDTKRFLEDRNILKILLSLSIPTMISGFVDSLYNTVDSMFVGHYVGSGGLAALSIINVIQLLYISIGVLFSVGNASIISRALGASHSERAISSLIHSFWITFFISNLISFLILANLEFCLKFIGTSTDIMPFAKQYGSIILWTGFILPINIMLLGALRAKGLALQSTYLNVFAAVTNICLDALFIIGFGWGVGGAALATAISQILMFIYALSKIKRLYRTSLLFSRAEKFNFSLIKEIVVIGLPTGLRLFVFVAVFSVANLIISNYGSDYLSAFGVTNRLISLFAMLLISLTMGAQPIIGMNYGAQHYDRVQLVILTSLKIAVSIASLTSLLLLWAPRELFLVFTSNEEIIRICQNISQIHGYTYWLWAFFICVAEAFQAIGHARQAFLLSLAYPISVLIFLWILPKFFLITGVWWAFPSSYICIGLLAVIMLIIELYRLKRKSENLKRAF